MKDHTIYECLICGENRLYPWKKSEREAHLLTHLDNIIEKQIVGHDGDRADLVTGPSDYVIRSQLKALGVWSDD